MTEETLPVRPSPDRDPHVAADGALSVGTRVEETATSRTQISNTMVKKGIAAELEFLTVGRFWS